jgi:hypothetical protein
MIFRNLLIVGTPYTTKRSITNVLLNVFASSNIVHRPTSDVLVYFEHAINGKLQPQQNCRWRLGSQTCTMSG